MNRRNPALIESVEPRVLFALATFVIDPAVSSLRLSGEVADVIDLEPQRDGSLVANYQGTIFADITDGAISFPGGSSVIAQATRSYDPGDGPANYGGESETDGLFSVKLGEAAIRDFEFDLRSVNLALSEAGAFSAGGLDVRTTDGILEYDLRVGGDGDSDLDGKTNANHITGNATLRGEGENRTLTIPIDFDLSAGEADLRFKGTLVAKSGTGAPIDPNVVRIGEGTLLKTVQFTDPDGTLTTITLTGGGSADVLFTNASQQTPGKTGTVVVGGTGIELVSVDATGTSAKTKLTMTGKGGDGLTIIRAVTADGSLASLGGKGVHLADTNTIGGALGSVTAARMTNVSLTAASIGTIKVTGAVTASTFTATAPFAAGRPAIRSFSSGDFTGSRITATGAIGSVKVKAFTFSEIHSGVTRTDVDLPTTDDLSADGSVASATVKTFFDSAIAASTLGRLNLGSISVENADSPTGVAADSIFSLQATNAAKQKLKLLAVSDSAALAAQLALQKFNLADFEIRLK